MVLGISLQGFIHAEEKSTMAEILPILGNVGLIMIVLEAALDLELKREKLGLIISSFLVALIALVVSSVGIAFLIMYLVPGDPNFTSSLAYAIPLSIMSSAIIIPSVESLRGAKKEFMVYESTFSDILGIMFFYFLMGSTEQDNTGEIVVSIVLNIVITLVLAIIIAYGLVYLFQQLKSQVKLFLIISVLMLMYAVSKSFHLSALIEILAFGLVLNNTNIFFRGRLNKLINEKDIKVIMHDFHIITLETAFVIRTFFFVIFGITISLASLIDLEVAMIAGLVIAILYLVRYLTLIAIIRKRIIPQLWIAPRGLITILLFFAIASEHPEMVIPGFDPGILLYTILISSVIMAAALIMDRGEKVKDVVLGNVKSNLQDLKGFPKSITGRSEDTIDAKLDAQLEADIDGYMNDGDKDDSSEKDESV